VPAQHAEAKRGEIALPDAHGFSGERRDETRIRAVVLVLLRELRGEQPPGLGRQSLPGAKVPADPVAEGALEGLDRQRRAKPLRGWATPAFDAIDGGDDGRAQPVDLIEHLPPSPRRALEAERPSDESAVPHGRPPRSEGLRRDQCGGRSPGHFGRSDLTAGYDETVPRECLDLRLDRMA